jgi:hypothetical protein
MSKARDYSYLNDIKAGDRLSLEDRAQISKREIDFPQTQAMINLYRVYCPSEAKDFNDWAILILSYDIIMSRFGRP